MKIYTKTGDKGETGLFGGERVNKNSYRIEAYGTVDELNSSIGLALTEVGDEEVKKILLKIQNELFVLGSDLASPDTEKNKKLNIRRVPKDFFLNAEMTIDQFENKLEPLKNFILPGGSKSAAMLHVCRTVCRRAERRVVELSGRENINGNIIVYLNRLSDLFFVLARYENYINNTPDTKWNI